ncbi:MAG: peptidase [Ferruginibacter sp.]|nr:peptidase [Ferruginibacter sp.]
MLFFFAIGPDNYGQQAILNQYGLWVISSDSDYQATIIKDPAKEMVDIKTMVPKITFDLRYSQNNNFTKVKLYPTLKTSFLRRPVAISVAAVQNELRQQGLGLKIFDAYRPYSVTEKMWLIVKDDRYAADPKNGSGHNRGIAVDLTIINMKTKMELNMGTDFDNFSDTAHHIFSSLPAEVLQNRLLLRRLMEKNGFKPLETEWWHYSYADGTAFELMDISFETLEKRKKKAVTR